MKGSVLTVYAYTDHHSDLRLLDWAGEGTAVNPDTRVREHCCRRIFRGQLGSRRMKGTV